MDDDDGGDESILANKLLTGLNTRNNTMTMVAKMEIKEKVATWLC